jgi:hypothetical protein
MKTRGRTSAEAQAMTVLAEPVERMQRPDAPYDLTDEEAKEWWAIVNRMPAEWFPRESHSTLTQLCRETVRARKVAQLAHEMESSSSNFDLKEYRALLRTEAELSRIIVHLATKLRITQQSTFDERKKKPVALTKPWDI